MYYISKYTHFTAKEKPYTDKIYFKEGNNTLVIIDVDENWNMVGHVKDPFNLPISPIKPLYGPLNQEQCERLLLINTPNRNRKDLLELYNMHEGMEYDTIMYRTRLINLINSYWLAWSEEDVAEDYHPRFNEAIMRERDLCSIKLDPEPEDLESSKPYLSFEEMKRLASRFEPIKKNNILDGLKASDKPFKSIYD